MARQTMSTGYSNSASVTMERVSTTSDIGETPQKKGEQAKNVAQGARKQEAGLRPRRIVRRRARHGTGGAKAARSSSCANRMSALHSMLWAPSARRARPDAMTEPASAGCAGAGHRAPAPPDGRDGSSGTPPPRGETRGRRRPHAEWSGAAAAPAPARSLRSPPGHHRRPDRAAPACGNHGPAPRPERRGRPQLRHGTARRQDRDAWAGPRRSCGSALEAPRWRRNRPKRIYWHRSCFKRTTPCAGRARGHILVKTDYIPELSEVRMERRAPEGPYTLDADDRAYIEGCLRQVEAAFGTQGFPGMPFEAIPGRALMRRFIVWWRTLEPEPKPRARPTPNCPAPSACSTPSRPIWRRRRAAAGADGRVPPHDFGPARVIGVRRPPPHAFAEPGSGGVRSAAFRASMQANRA